MKQLKNRIALVCISLLTVIAVAAFKGCPDRTRSVATGGEVNGSVFYLAAVQKTAGSNAAARIFMPDIEVYLHNPGSGVDSPYRRH